MEGDEPGKFDGFRCNAQYNRNNDFQARPAVWNFINVDSLAQNREMFYIGADEHSDHWQAATNEMDSLYETQY